MIPEHHCEHSAEAKVATPDRPYHYVGSGLPNVYLSGIKYWVCPECAQQAAEIPSLDRLLKEIARAIVEKPSPLTGSQVRFLRKRPTKRSTDFAAMISITPQRLSVLEASDSSILAAGRDKLVRIVYRALSGDKKLRNALAEEDEFEKWITSIRGRDNRERIVATWLPSRQWRVEAETVAA
jgi:DNA-binding transcriptional regulator YiaG